VERVRRREDSTIDTYAQDLALIVSAELAEIKLLDEFFGVKLQDAQLAFGYSLGELTALVACGVFDLETALTPVLAHANDAAELGRDVRLGVLFSRGPALDFAAVRRLCLQITAEGKGTIAISTYLSPNTVLLLGQRDTVERFGAIMHEVLPEPAHLRKNPNNWPPMHTPITWQRCIPNRVGVMIGPARGGFTAPKPPILSCVTGAASYTDVNSREIMVQWVDHPQRVWDVVDKVLAAGVETVIHVGPEPNILPATFTRLANNVTAQLSGRSLASMGLRAMSRIVRRPRPWLTSRISADATLLRAPFVKQVTLEEWLLEQKVK
jgi:[acyl-carrier-protein] S-malonyltransferase